VIVLDTNVISETMRKAPDARVIAWLDATPFRTLYLSAVTVAEIRYGLAAMPAGARRERMGDRFETRIMPLFAKRVLPFDVAEAAAYAELMAAARAMGIAIGRSDGYIAATAKAAGMSIATRDGAFRATGVHVIDPWERP
jgi:toxin FitB